MSRILLVEPDASLAAVYVAALRQDGSDIVWRRTAASSVAALDESAIDLVVLELNMANHNGVEFLYEIRSYPDLQNIPVILHTSVRQTQLDAEALRQLGVDVVLYKPLTSLVELQQATQRSLRAGK